ncbi:hypothetical protein ACHAWT_011243 [Skeletonema menzelii]
MAYSSNHSSPSKGAIKGNNRKSSSLPSETVEYLKAWMMSPEHVAHPYPTEQEKAQIMADTGIELKQLTNWFVNNRKRYWKPRVEAKLQQRFASAASSESTSSTSYSPVSVPAGPGGAGGALPLSISQAHQMALLQNAAAAGVARKRANDDFAHPVSEGSATSSTCNSDDDSIETGCGSSLSSASRHKGNPLYASAMGAAGSSVCSSAVPLRREEVDVYVLRPETGDADALPTIRDMTIKSNAPSDRILATFPKIGIHYTIPKEIEHDRKKVQTRRDGEVLRVKKHYLKLYLATRGIHSVSSPLGATSLYVDDKPNNVSLPTSPYFPDNVGISTTSPSTPTGGEVFPSKVKPYLSDSCGDDVVSALHTVSPPLAFHKNAFGRRPRAFTCTAIDDNNNDYAAVQRKRARTSSAICGGEDEWRELCQNAQSLNCDSLPGLEEAARMFGFAC